MLFDTTMSLLASSLSWYMAGISGASIAGWVLGEGGNGKEGAVG